MRFMIRSDIEGVTGVTTYAEAEGSAFGRAMLANDLNACLEGLLAAGDHEIVIYDEHTDGRNVDLAALPDCVSVIRGKPPYRPEWGGIDAGFDAMLMVGFHARSGVAGALLPHTYSRKNLNLRINGVLLGEIGVEAAIAGDFDVPLWLVTGDSAGMAEAEATVPNVKTVTVKEAMGEFAARCLPPRLTARLIREAAEKVVTTPPEVSPLKFAGPVEMQIDLASSDYTRKLKTACPDLFVAEDTIRIAGQTVTEVWSAYTRIQSEVKQACN
jgi:D-amino peptidase